MLTNLSKMINDAQQAGLAYRQVIDRTIGLTDARRAVPPLRSQRRSTGH